MRDDEAFALGIMRLLLKVSVDGERLRLIATFPDLYPYFRFEVEAPDLDLLHHQNPLGKNLCLIGRGTEHWNTNYTLAHLLLEQLPGVLQTGRAITIESVRGIEQQQAEPFSEFYPYYPASMIITPDELRVPLRYDCGSFTVAVNESQRAPPGHLVRGIIAEFRTQSGKRLYEPNVALLSAFPGRRLAGTWVRVPEPIKHFKPLEFLSEVLEYSPFTRSARPNKVKDGWLRIWAVLFPEEVGWRAVGQGIVFISAFDKKRPGGSRRTQSSQLHSREKTRKKRKQSRKDRKRNWR